MLSISRSIFSYNFSSVSKVRHSVDLSLYLVANRPSYPDETLFLSKIKESVQGGVSCVQLRDHQNSYAAILRVAKHLKQILKGTPLFINTLHSLQVAQAIEAEGIYLEEKIPYSEVRKVLGQKIIIGIPVKTMNEVLVAQENKNIDYLSVKVFSSKKTCAKNDLLWGIEGLRNIRQLSTHRLVAIGGLQLEYAESIYRELHFNDGIAMASGLMEEENPYATAQKICTIGQRIRGGNHEYL